MSWSASFLSRAAFESDQPDSASPAIEAIREIPMTRVQYVLARQAAELLLSRPGVLPAEGETPEDEEGWSQTLPAKDVEFTVYLSGHANHDHRPVSGMANDTINVSVTQR